MRKLTVPLFVILTLALFASLKCNRKQVADAQKIKSMVIHYVDLEIESPVQISCDGFENFSSYKVVEIKDEKLLNDFARHLAEIHVSNDQTPIDVRVKILVTHIDQTATAICMDQFAEIIVDGKLIDHNNSIVEIIKRQIEK
jgi:hypothetical protein